MLEPIRFLPSDFTRARARSSNRSRGKVAAFVAASAAILAAAIFTIGCQFTTPELGIGYNTHTGTIGLNIGQMVIGKPTTNAPALPINDASTNGVNNALQLE